MKVKYELSDKETYIIYIVVVVYLACLRLLVLLIALDFLQPHNLWLSLNNIIYIKQ